MIILGEQDNRSKKEKCFTELILCVSGILLNYLGSFIANTFSLHMYLDSIGTVTVSCLSGYIPGIIVGLLSNMLASSFDTASISYGTLNVLIAVVAAYFADRGWFKKIPGILLSILSFAFIGGVLGGILTYFLYGAGGESATSSVVLFLRGKAGMSYLSAEIFGGFLIDIIDKAITVVASLLIIKIIPKSIEKKFHFGAWKQAPLSREAVRAMKKTDTRLLSLSAKLMCIIFIASVSIGIVATGISYVLYRESNIDTEGELAQSAARMVANAINPDKVDEYIQLGEDADGYIETEAVLYELKKISENVKYIYVFKLLDNGVQVVFDLDTPDVKGDDPGSIHGYDDDYLPYVPESKDTDELEPVISRTSYGWLMTVYEPVYDKDGNCVCFAGADVSMEGIHKKCRSFLARLISLFLGILILILAFGLRISKYNIILPLKSMALTAGEYKNTSHDSMEKTAMNFESLEITTGDEIENLYSTFSDMIEENLEYINDIQKKNETINEMQRGLIVVLADIVESRDQNTGDHVRKTAAYVKMIMDEMKEKGIYTDKLTDKFMSDVYQSAPLHDVGKIAVSDVILNKPGKLTDEEFDIMKTHTTVGAEIIDRVLKNVPDDGSGYLKEARDLALYHHEKWNGQGYPTGLSGEDIPLSARIMAVADVFDALVSTRSYKKGFPFEKAISIIEESSGSHFDPKIAGAFLNAKDKAREIAESNE